MPQKCSNHVFGQNRSLEEWSQARFCPTILGATCSSVQTYCPALTRGQVHAAFAFPGRSSVQCPRLAPGLRAPFRAADVSEHRWPIVLAHACPAHMICMVARLGAHGFLDSGPAPQEQGSLKLKLFTVGARRFLENCVFSGAAVRSHIRKGQ